MQVIIEKKIKCNNGVGKGSAFECSEKIKKKLQDKFGSSWHEDTKQSSYHVSILHENNKHKIWIYFYEKDGEHLSSYLGKEIKTKSDNVIKHPILPTGEQIIECLK